MSNANLNEKWSKVLKKLPEWTSAAESKSTDELEKEILKQQGVFTDTEHEMSNDAKYISLSEELKELRKHYREIMSEAQAKSAYCLYLLRSRGKKVSKSDGD